MPVSDFDLWPDQIAVDAMPPVVLLQMQANALKNKTSGVLEARVQSETVECEASFDRPEGLEEEHSLYLIAPTLRYEERVLVASHEKDRLYPVFLGPGEVAHSQDEFIKLLREKLRSKRIMSAMQSMIARSNEARKV